MTFAETRRSLLQRVAALNESFAKHEISWEEWDAQITPVLQTLSPELDRGYAQAGRHTRQPAAAPELVSR
jgi:hypothetical protein